MFAILTQSPFGVGLAIVAAVVVLLLVWRLACRRGYAAGLVDGRVEGERVGVTRGRDQVEAELASRRLADTVARTGVPARTRQNGGRRRGDPR